MKKYLKKIKRCEECPNAMLDVTCIWCGRATHGEAPWTPALKPATGENHHHREAGEGNGEDDLGLDLRPAGVAQVRGEHRPGVDRSKTNLDENGADRYAPPAGTTEHALSISYRMTAR